MIRSVATSSCSSGVISHVVDIQKKKTMMIHHRSSYHHHNRHPNVENRCCGGKDVVKNKNAFRIVRSIAFVCLILLMHFLRVADATATAVATTTSTTETSAVISSSSPSLSKISTSFTDKIQQRRRRESSRIPRRRNLQQQQQMNDDDLVVITVDKNDASDGFVVLDNFEQLDELTNAATFVIQRLLQIQAQQQAQGEDGGVLDRYTFLPLSYGVVTTSTDISYQPQIVLAFQKVTRGVYWKLVFKIVLLSNENGGDNINTSTNNNDNICVGSLEVIVHFLGDYTIDEWREEYTCEEANEIYQGNYILVVADDEDDEDEGQNDDSDPNGGNNIDTSFTKCCYERIDNYYSRSEIVNAAWFAVQQLQQQQQQQRDDDDSIIDYYTFLPFDSYEKYSYQPYILDAYQQIVGGSNWKLKIMILSEKPLPSSSSSISSSSQQQQQRGNINADACIGVFEVLIYNDNRGDLSITEWGKETSCEDEFVFDDNDPVTGGGGGGDTGNVKNNNNNIKSGVDNNNISQLMMLFHGSSNTNLFNLMVVMVISSSLLI